MFHAIHQPSKCQWEERHSWWGGWGSPRRGWCWWSSDRSCPLRSGCPTHQGQEDRWAGEERFLQSLMYHYVTGILTTPSQPMMKHPFLREVQKQNFETVGSPILMPEKWFPKSKFWIRYISYLSLREVDCKCKKRPEKVGHGVRKSGTWIGSVCPVAIYAPTIILSGRSPWGNRGSIIQRCLFWTECF